MKKTIMAMLLASTLMFTACSDLAKTGISSFEENGTGKISMNEETTEETAKEIFAKKNAEPTEETEEASLQGTRDNHSSESETSSEQTVPANVTIKVTDAVNKSFKNGKVKYTFKVPKVTISGVDTSDANREIDNSVINDKLEYAQSYKYYISKNIVSILLCKEYLDYSDDIITKLNPFYPSVEVYNIEISSGRLIDGSELLKMYGTTDEAFLSETIPIIKKFYSEILKKSKLKGKAKENMKKWYNANLECKDVELLPYINDKGHLCFFRRVAGEGMIGGAHISCDTSTKKYILIDHYTTISKAK